MNATPEPPQATQPKPRTRKLMAVASGKGGVGKTWFSITLAHAMSRKSKRVLLFDGDLGLANLDIQLGLMPKNDLSAVVAGSLTLNQAVEVYDDGGFDIIAGRSGSGSLSSIPTNRLQTLGQDLQVLAANYDRVILDLGAGIEGTVRQLTHNVGTVAVLVTDEPTSLTDAYAFVKVTHMDRPGTDIRIVVNGANSTREGQRTYNTLLKACEGFLKISPPLLGVIRRDPKVKEAIRNQQPLLMRYPNCEAASDVEAIAAKLLA